MATTMGAYKIFVGEVIGAGGTATSEPIEMGTASVLALHLTAIAGVGADVTFTYSLGNNRDDTFITPSSPVTIGANLAATDVLDFSPELAKFIKITATNNAAADVTISATLCVQETD